MAGDLIKDVGFPAFICLWLLVRTDTYIRELTIAVRELTQWLRDRKET